MHNGNHLKHLENNTNRRLYKYTAHVFPLVEIKSRGTSNVLILFAIVAGIATHS